MKKTTPKMRYEKVLNGLKDEWAAKTAVSLLLSIWAILQQMFATHVELIALLLIAVIIDFITGRSAAKKKKVQITSYGYRQTPVKIIEYAAMLFIIIGISNVFGNADIDGWVGGVLSYLQHIDYFAFLFLTITELKSTAENISGKDGDLSELVETISKKIFK